MTQVTTTKTSDDHRAQLTLSDVSVAYQSITAVHEVSLTLAEGQVGCLLGPSGCGKTTLLRAIAGFEPLSQGIIQIKDTVVSSISHRVAPEKRRIGMVFQDFALFPHLTVRRNIEFGLRRITKAQRNQRVDELLELVGLSDYAQSYPHELSGGQQQRIALARALAPEPDILLLDEPFSSLDAELREQLALEVRDVLRHRNTTAILVTHDQQEAFAMSDTIAVMSQGVIQQCDTAYELYHNPKNRFVADFIGEGSFVCGVANEHGILHSGLGDITVVAPTNVKLGSEYEVLIRPDDLIYDEQSSLSFPVVEKSFCGEHYAYTLALPNGEQVFCHVSSHIDQPLGESLPISPDLKHLVVFPKDR